MSAGSGAASAPDPLLTALAADLDGTFEGLVTAYQGRLYGFALRFCGDRRDAEEIAQDAFIRAYRALHGYDAARIRELALRPWLYQITINVARNHARKRRPHITPLDAEPGHDEATNQILADDRSQRPEAIVERAETGALLASLVTDLPARYRAAVILRHIAGLPYPEVAATLDQPLGTVKANIHRGVQLLRMAWQEQAAQEEEVHGQRSSTTTASLPAIRARVARPRGNGSARGVAPRGVERTRPR
ncbi:MAG TPA: sigma-70 family RNA polymerase sigma factor [Thermomicrobiales bacterium]|jgi:RNA polymerase sigma-70 factor (ECF subfamily)